mmetsp:Transcript_26209/g.61164  ORF Transcript_26209/g.61164 Transcript_26209/m.61164 type:complete len:529 (-) Transcript_26209:48-1634(-)
MSTGSGREDLSVPLKEHSSQSSTAPAPDKCEGAWREACSDPASSSQDAASASSSLPPPSARTPLWTLKATQLCGTAAYACLAKFLPVFYARIGVSRSAIGGLQFVGPGVAFVGNIFWATVIDKSRDYKTILVSTSIVGSGITFLQLLPLVQHSVPLLYAVTIVSGFILCTGGPIIDALCLTVLKEWPDSGEVYGDQRLWCAVGWGGMSLLMGRMVDLFGMSVAFTGYAIFSVINLSIILIWFPSPKKRSSQNSATSVAASESATSSPNEGGASSEPEVPAVEEGRQSADTSSNQDNQASQEQEAAPSICNLEVAWFFLNLFQYGICFSLVENLLLVFLQQDFVGTSNLLLGGSVAMMCAFEVPVFKYVDRLWTRAGVGLTGVIAMCQIILAVRCLLYIILPEDKPWTVLLVEPLHGITFAGMWAATVEYGNRLAGPNAVARMQSMVNGIFYMLSLAVGSFIWGFVVEPPGKGGIGFRRAFAVDAAIVLIWSVVWQLGLRFLRLRQSRQEARALRPATTGPASSSEPPA